MSELFVDDGLGGFMSPVLQEERDRATDREAGFATSIITPDQEGDFARGFRDTSATANILDKLNRIKPGTPISEIFTDQSFGPADPTFDALSEENLKGWEPWATTLAGARNASELSYIKMQIRQDMSEKEMIQNSGSGFLGSLSGYIFDPITILTGSVSGSGRLLGALAGEEMARNVGKTVKDDSVGIALGVGAGVAANLLMQSLRAPVRAGARNLPPTTGMAKGHHEDFVEGMEKEVGEAEAAMTGREFEDAPTPASAGRDPLDPQTTDAKASADKLREDTAQRADTPPAASEGRIIDPDARPEGTAGAQTVSTPKTYNERLAEESLLLPEHKGRALKWITEQVLKLPESPLRRVLQSTDLYAREVVQGLVENPYFMYKHQLGIPSEQSVEGAMRKRWAPFVEMNQAVDRLYDSYRISTGNQLPGEVPAKGPFTGLVESVGDTFRGGAPNGKMTRAEFKGELGRALHTGDEHAIPEVAAAAQEYRKLLNNYKEEAMAEGVFSAPLRNEIRRIEEMLESGKSSTRSAGKLRATIKFLQKEADRLDTEGPQFTNAKSFFPMIYRHDAILRQMPEFRKRIREHLQDTGVPLRELDGAVDDVVNKILRNDHFNRLDEDIVGSARSLKERSLDIPPEKVMDFLEHDAESIMRHYVQSVGTDIELTKRFGDATMKDHIAEIKANFDARLAEAKGAKNAKNIAMERDEVLRDIRGIRDRLRGTYGLPDDPYRPLSRIYRAAKAYNYLTMMGGVVISSGPDLARIAMVDGMERAMRQAYLPLIRGLKGLKLNKKEAMIAGGALENELATMSRHMADTGDVFGKKTAFEEFLVQSNGPFSVVNLFNAWNSTMKGMAASVTGARIIEDALALRVSRLRSSSSTIVDVPGLVSQRDGRKLGAAYNRKSNTVKINPEEVDQGWKDRAWENPKMEGVDALPPDFIRTKAEWRQFVVNHELAHADYPILKDAKGNVIEEAAEYENRMNRVAASRIWLRRNSIKGGDKFSVEKLARGGINEELADRIGAQWEQYGQIDTQAARFKNNSSATTDDGGMMVFNAGNWKDAHAANRFRETVAAEIDRTIVTPGAGDVPLWMSTELGSVIGQFKTFGMASMGRVVIPALQQADSEIMMGLMYMTALGMIVHKLKAGLGGYDNQLENDSVADWLGNGLDRSGALAYFSDVNRVVETMSGGQLGFGATGQPASLKQGAGVLGGPTGGQIANIGNILGDVVSGSADRYTVSAARRLAVGQNIFYLDPLFDGIQSFGNSPTTDLGE
jgi:hypothetical protein